MSFEFLNSLDYFVITFFVIPATFCYILTALAHVYRLEKLTNAEYAAIVAYSLIWPLTVPVTLLYFTCRIVAGTVTAGETKTATPNE